jgi:porphobilinogen synthase
MVAEATVTRDDLVQPVFVKEGISEPAPVKSMPGIQQHTLESLRKETVELRDAGVRAAIVFGIPAHKDARGSAADDEHGISQEALRAMRSEVGNEMLLIGDLCMCEYTDHGHCGVFAPGTDVPDDERDVDNDLTLERYRSIALAQADAGADIIAPSGMMDGQVAAIRDALDGAGRHDLAILAYASKYASAEYGPFRDAAEGAPQFGDRRRYQMDLPNRREALAEATLDVAEGADIVMVKPALAYLDVIAAVRQRVDLPVAAYHVSGEYSMVKAAAEKGWIDGDRVAHEHLTAIKRAGADMILTYFAKDYATRLASGR